MTYTFFQSLPEGLSDQLTVISGHSSLSFSGSEYLVIEKENNVKAFEIKYQYHCSPFKEATITGEMLLVGHEGHFYLYDLQNQQNILSLEMNGYFGHLYLHRQLFYVCDASGIYCINPSGEVIWQKSGLGIDGVYVKSFTENTLFGRGQCDPPDGWENFSLDIKTGEFVPEDVG